MLLIMYQIFSSLLGYLPFSVQFFPHFYGVTFFGTPNINNTYNNNVKGVIWGFEAGSNHNATQTLPLSIAGLIFIAQARNEKQNFEFGCWPPCRGPPCRGCIGIFRAINPFHRDVFIQ